MNNLWILGAPDPEMQKIEGLLSQCGESYQYAYSGSSRVNPGNAYQADPVDCEADVFYLVECGFIAESAVRSVIVDHHKPGDPGYGGRPEQFLEFSSLGQVISRLAQLNKIPREWDGVGMVFGEVGHITLVDERYGVCTHSADVYHPAYGQGMGDYGAEATYAFIPREFVLCAAADHCLSSAYRGACPGVDPDELMEWRIRIRAAFQGRDAEEVLADVNAARMKIQSALKDESPKGCGNHQHINGDVVLDFRGQHIPELPEAAAREGIAVLAGPVGKDSPPKYVLLSGGPAVISAFLDGEIAPELVRRYGDPQRGFAGGYHGS